MSLAYNVVRISTEEEARITPKLSQTAQGIYPANASASDATPEEAKAANRQEHGLLSRRFSMNHESLCCELTEVQTGKLTSLLCYVQSTVQACHLHH